MKQLPMFAAVVILVALTVIAQEQTAVDEIVPNDGAVTSEPAAPEDAAETSALVELEWMVGQWVDRGEVATITTDCSWTANHKFLSRSFQVTSDGQVTLEGAQVIGWDPVEGQIRSWTFDSEGGFGEGRWIRDGNRWLVKTAFTLASGERASALNVFTYVDENTFNWQSTDREIGGELQPSIPEVTVVRVPAAEDEAEQNTEEVSK